MNIALSEWLQLTDANKRNIFAETARKKALPISSIEKDWWVVQTLSALFSTEYADKLIFKGGTSLSKGWNLIERFSEDIDLVLDREFLGFAGELSNKQIHKLRYVSYEFISTKFVTALDLSFKKMGYKNVIVKPQEVVNHDQDPLIIEIYYPKLTGHDIYLRPDILVEIGSRSLKEPYSPRNITTFVSETFAEMPFADNSIIVPTVNPERTLLEKIFLLHEEYQRPPEKMRVERLSRHLYDIEKLSQTPYFQKAMNDKELYNTIIAHRERFSRLGGVDYTKHAPEYIQIVPPKKWLLLWEDDYERMKNSMIYGEKISFNELITRIDKVQNAINLCKIKQIQHV
ncbi:MAG: nucleotidyl transferase AbiEii/AbiGii toxin family protein [Bacteroidales bacterium]|nr:nucleotidyl transferase AbiEii/AbiGii toxin family protein [Bacteroidales bacterium]